MRISRVHTELPLREGTIVELPAAASHYISKVLRLGVNAELILFNGNSFEYSAKIKEVQKKSVLVEILNQLPAETESPLRTQLALGISKSERMDYAIQKSTELGVSEIIPLFTQTCEVKLSQERIQRRLNHWQQIAISASEQCGRVSVPRILTPLNLTAWLEDCDADIKFICDHRSEQGIRADQACNKVALLIGPEGGFSPAELSQAQAAGFKAINMGPRVLRTETAPVAALSILQFLYGDLN